MSERRYKVGDYVVLNDIHEKVVAVYQGNTLFRTGVVVYIADISLTNNTVYMIKIPEFLVDDSGGIFISDEHIDHRATTELNKE